jgi:putative ABC transport system permease protein
MLKNYFKIALRSLIKDKIYSIITILGLSVGIGCCILISIFVKHELNYDIFQKKGDRIVRVIMDYGMGGNCRKGNYTSTKVGPSFKKNFPEVEQFVRISNTKRVVKYDDKAFVEKRFVYADSTFLNIFSFKLLHGNATNALSQPENILLTETAAKKYFGNQNPIGKTIKVSTRGIDYHITGVLQDCPENSQIKFDFVASFSSLGPAQEETYWNANYNTFLLLKNNGSIHTLQPKIPVFMKKEMVGVFTGNDYLTYDLEPFLNVHLHSEYAGFEPNGSITYIYFISAIALLILVIVCSTFINLATAKSTERAKEIGIRKVAGAKKKQIFWQFLGESFITVILSTVLSILLVAILLPHFNDLMARRLNLNQLLTFNIGIIILVIIIAVGFLGGAYPALVLSKFKPIKVLKGNFKNTSSGTLLRKSLLVFQFSITIFLIICTIVIQNQLHFIQTKKLGFEKEHLIVLPFDEIVRSKMSTFKTELKKNNAVENLSCAHSEPCSIVGGYNMSKPEMPLGSQYAVNASGIDEEYLDACKIKILTGSNINKQHITDASNEDYTKNYFHFILNESAAKQLGWTAKEAIGKKMFLDETRPGEVIGVVKDFHFASIHNPIKPLVLFPSDYGSYLFAKVSGKQMKENLMYLNEVWKKLFNHRPFEYNFLTDDYNAMYLSEIQLGKAINTFTFIGILLACLGLFGLSSYNIQQRSKEIGIRKILGAPMANIALKLSSNFILLILFAIFIASPIAWYIMNKWLQNFSYKIEISVWHFFMAGTSLVLVAFLTVSVKSIAAASTNPVKHLRTE